MSSCVYWIRLPEHTNSLLQGYVGVAQNFNKRMVEHSRKSHTDCNSPILENAIRKYGWDNLIKEIIVKAEDQYCYDIEHSLRPAPRIGWNGSIGGYQKGFSGCKHTSESAKKIALANTGKKRTEKTKSILSKQKLGDKNPMYGKTHPQERKAKIGESLRGSNAPSYDPTIRVFFHEEFGAMHCTSYELQQKYNLQRGNLTKIIDGSRKSHKGWRYLGEKG